MRQKLVFPAENVSSAAKIREIRDFHTAFLTFLSRLIINEV